VSDDDVTRRTIWPDEAEQQRFEEEARKFVQFHAGWWGTLPREREESEQDLGRSTVWPDPVRSNQ
jgi:hypothetical protein